MDAVTAIGLRGAYAVTQLAASWWLSGTGHDGLLMLDFPVGGKQFDSLESAQEWADRVDAVKTRETEVSGT